MVVYYTQVGNVTAFPKVMDLPQTDLCAYADNDTLLSRVSE